MPPTQGVPRKREDVDRPRHLDNDWGRDELALNNPIRERWPADMKGIALGERWPTVGTAEVLLSKDALISGISRGIGDPEIFSVIAQRIAQRQDEPVSASPPADLAEAMQELAEVTADAEEDGLEVPSATAMSNAERLLKSMYRISPRRYLVYPMSDAYIAIDARGANDGIIVVMCGSDGGVLCLATINEESRRARYSTARKLPDGFIREALFELGEKPSR